MENPLISVIIPVYKVEKFLDQCIESVVNQTYKNLEIILVDDGSPDHCGEMCDAWAVKDRRIRVIHQRNAGVSAARNAGLDIAMGEYLGFVDSDDYIAAEMYEICYSAIEESGKKISICYPNRVDEDGSRYYPNVRYCERELDTESALNAVFYGNVEQSVWSKLFHRSVFEGLRFADREINEEIPLAVPMFVASGGAVNTGQALYYYRSTTGSLTQSYWKKDYGIFLKHLAEIQQQLEQHQLTKCKAAFDHLVATTSYSAALQLDKNYGRISNDAKKTHKKYLSLMRRKCLIFLRSSYVKVKDKILYLMIISRILRPVYSFLGKELH